MAHKRIKAYIGTLRLQSVLIAATTLSAGVKNYLDKGGIDLFVVSLIIIAVKVLYIPNKLHRTWASVEYTVEKDFLMNIPMLIIICCGIVVLTFFSLSSILPLPGGASVLPLVNAISVVLIGLFFIISRKKAIGQIVGLVVIENGLFITALFASNGLPFIVDMGILVDLITSVLIMGIMVFRINEHHGSIDTDKLNNLRG